jgi:hypothetical protein
MHARQGETHSLTILRTKEIWANAWKNQQHSGKYIAKYLNLELFHYNPLYKFGQILGASPRVKDRPYIFHGSTPGRLRN